MKTLFLLGALTIGSFTVTAQGALLVQNGIVHATVNEMIIVNDDFSEIAISEVPQTVKDAIAKNFPTATLDKAFVNDEKQYKLVLSLEDGTAGTLYADEDGNWLDM